MKLKGKEVRFIRMLQNVTAVKVAATLGMTSGNLSIIENSPNKGFTEEQSATILDLLRMSEADVMAVRECIAKISK